MVFKIKMMVHTLNDELEHWTESIRFQSPWYKRSTLYEDVITSEFMKIPGHPYLFFTSFSDCLMSLTTLDIIQSTHIGLRILNFRKFLYNTICLCALYQRLVNYSVKRTE